MLIRLTYLIIIIFIQKGCGDINVLYEIKEKQQNHSSWEETGYINKTMAGDEEFVVKGTRITYFLDVNKNKLFKLVTFYVADKRGYRARVKYFEADPNVKDIEIIRKINSQTLKTLAG